MIVFVFAVCGIEWRTVSQWYVLSGLHYPGNRYVSDSNVPSINSENACELLLGDVWWDICGLASAIVVGLFSTLWYPDN